MPVCCRRPPSSSPYSSHICYCFRAQLDHPLDSSSTKAKPSYQPQQDEPILWIETKRDWSYDGPDRWHVRIRPNGTSPMSVYPCPGRLSFFRAFPFVLKICSPAGKKACWICLSIFAPRSANRQRRRRISLGSALSSTWVNFWRRLSFWGDRFFRCSVLTGKLGCGSLARWPSPRCAPRARGPCALASGV